MQGVDETSSHLPRLPEVGDSSVHHGTANAHGDGQNRAGTLYSQLAQQQQRAPGPAPQPYEMGGPVRGSSAAAAALEMAQVSSLACVQHALGGCSLACSDGLHVVYSHRLVFVPCCPPAYCLFHYVAAQQDIFYAPVDVDQGLQVPV